MYVYRTPQFNQNAERYGIQAQLDRFCVELETHNIDEVQSHFKRIYPYLKRKVDHNLRLIAKILKVDETLILCLLDILKRGGKEYEHFLLNPPEFGKNHLEAQLHQPELQHWLNQRKQSEGYLPTSRAPLPEAFRPWLEPPGWEIETSQKSWLIIYESQEWLRRFNHPEIQRHWETYHRILEEIVDKPQQFEALPHWSGVYLQGQEGQYVLFSMIETVDIPTHQVLFLLAPFTHQPSIAEIHKIGQTTNLFGATESIITRKIRLDELTPFARRSYPSYLITDQQSWLAIEQGAEVNLALSAEEEAILNSVSSPLQTQNCLPLFLNGRAGSGKSTMLLYLFADYCYRKYYNKEKQELPGNPLFLTYNKRLLEVAKELVRQLLSSHHRFLLQREVGDKMPDISPFFQPFGRFLLNLLPPKERFHEANPKGLRFDPVKYISFHRFRQLYRDSQLPQAKQYSPELSWHVIRTFIKGYSLDGYLTPEDYQQEIPHKERTIPVDEFLQIHKTIWGRWYRTLMAKQGYWDDQDLIREVLQLKCYRPDYTAIFCDEAQDFTRLELQLIMRLSVFSHYDLGNQPIRSLPFAFAGDPFQTLNPTGFRWESVQAAFYNEVITSVDPAQKLNLGMNLPELKSNYRSIAPIVPVINLIQLCRQVLFKIPQLQPQTAWKQGNFPEPQKFVIGRNIQKAELRQYLKDTIIIVPCEEGGEVAYAQNDEILSQILAGVGESEPLKNVLSAIAAKGLEFKRVILYKFGEECNKAVWTLISKRQEYPVEFEFFFNKLYVAASRAKERLFVVDSQKGDEQLWSYIETHLDTLLENSENPHWREKVHPIQLGTSEVAPQLAEDDRSSIAQEFETRGLDAQDPDFLKRAKQYYSDLGNTTKAAICEAWALKFEQNFPEAGQRFLKLGMANEALDCFWQGMCWLEVAAWYEQYAEAESAERYIAVFMSQKPSLKTVRDFSQFLHSCIGSNQFENSHNSRQWKIAIEEYAKGIAGLINGHQLKQPEWQLLGEVLAALGEAGYNGMLYRSGLCFYSAKNYQRAMESWEACEATRQPKYYLVKAEVLGFPAGLEYLEKAGKGDRIINEWNLAGKPQDATWLKYVGASLLKRNQYIDALQVFCWSNDLPKVKDCFEKLSSGKPKINVLQLFLEYLIDHQHWGEAIEVIEKYFPKAVGSRAEKASLRRNIVRKLAESDLNADEIKAEYRQRYEKFMKQIISQQNWQQYLSVSLVGTALEKIGGLGVTLEFYQSFCNHSESQLRQLARERWLVNKRKQENYHRTKGEIHKAEDIHLEIAEKTAQWNI